MKWFHRCTFDSTKWIKLGESKIIQLVETPVEKYFWTVGFAKDNQDIKPFTEVNKGTEVTYTNTCLTCGLLHSKKITY